jgi:hypothetical protein
VDHAGHVVLVERALELRQVGHVAVHARQRHELLIRQREPEAVLASAEVVRDDLVAAVEQRADGPGADRPERPGDQVAHPRSSN